ncbi:MAG: polysaccharide biosynthesis tyrosine autokinase [Planctomycetota bacterium]|nr:polysaccharide biosynthesis tyrosine autokinase [Planctomycetota bacterium]
MNESEKYPDHAGGHEIVNFEIPPESSDEAASDLVVGIFRRWYIVFLVFLVLCGAGLPAVLFYVKPMHSVTGAIRVKPDEQNVITGESEGGITDYESFMNTQAEKITSSSVVQRVADAFLNKNLSFFDDEPSGLISKLEKKLVIGGSKLEPAARLKKAIVSEKVIVVAAERASQLIKVTMHSTDAEEAKQIVDAFIRAYMDIEVFSALEDENAQLRLLETRRDMLAVQMDSDRQTRYQLAQEFGSVALESREDMQLQRYADLLSRLTTVQAERIELEAQVLLLERTKEQPISPTELLQMRQDHINQDPAVLALMPTISQLEQEFIVAKQLLQPTHPEYRSKRENLEALKVHLEELKQEASQAFDERVTKEAADAGNKLLVAVRNNLEQKRTYEKSLETEISKVDIQTVTVGRKQLAIQELQDNLAFAQERYDVVVGRIQDLELQRQRPARISVHYNADVVSINDKRVKLSAAVIFVALVCGMGLAYLRDKADQSLRTPDDVAKRIGMRIIGTTTSLHTVKPAYLPEQIVGDYQTIRANLGLLSEKGIPKKLVVTSPGMKEGKTTFAVNLATSMAEAGKRVLLIDGDLRKPDVARLLNLPKGTRGLQDVLCGIKFEQAVFSMASTGLDVLAADFENTADAYELLAMPSTAKRIEMISRKYDHVIIDTPPTLGFPDALVWAKIGGAAILVSYAGHTTLPDLKEAKERLTETGVQVLGTVLSSVQAGHGYYRHGHGYYTQSASSREAAGLHRRKLMFSMDEDLDDVDDLDTPQES